MSGSAVIIGAGIGGLASAVRLAGKGGDVTLLEKEPRTGGYAVAYRRQGYTFDLSLHVVPSGGAGQEFRAMVESLGISDKVRFIRLNEGFRVILGEDRFQLPNDYQELQEMLAGAFPQERDGLRLFFNDLEKHAVSYAGIFDYTVSKFRSVPPFLPRIPSFLKHCRMSTREYLEKFFRDKKLKALLYQPASFMGIPMGDFPAVNFMIMFYLLMKYGMYTIAGGGQALSDALRDRFQSLGGRLLTGKKAVSIIVDGQKAVAVVTEDGQRYDCDFVLCGNNIHDVVNRMIGRSNFADSYLATLDSLASSISVSALNIGLDCHPGRLGLDSHMTMVFPDPDIDRCFMRQSCQLDMSAFSITAPCNADPDLFANGRYTISLVGGTDPGRWLAMDEDAYRAEKKKVVRAAIDRADALFPGLKQHVRVADLATPKTMQRYTGNPGGAIMGFNCTCGMHRQIMKAARIPVSNLVMAGAWTNRLGGYMQSMKSGILAAEAVC